MNNIIIRQTKPDPDYNTVFTFSAKVLPQYEKLRKWFVVELEEGEEIFTGKDYIWKMNLSNYKIELVIKALQELFKGLRVAHGYTEEIIPSQPQQKFQSLKK